MKIGQLIAIQASLPTIDGIRRRLYAYSDDETRDSHGKWTTSGGETMYEAKSPTGQKLLKEKEHLSSIRIPPAWKDVSVNPDPHGKLMVVGKDVKGRSQHLYSKQFSAGQAEAKFARMADLEKQMPAIIKKNEANLKSDDPKTREQAALLALIIHTGIRPGGEGDTGADKKAFGATTLQGRHVYQKPDGTARLKFVGKKGVNLKLYVTDKSIAADLAQRADDAGHTGKLFPDTSAHDLLGYVKSVTGSDDIKTKDFRTLLANRIAVAEVSKTKAPSDPKSFKKTVKAIATKVAEKLGNTAAIALASYIHPGVFASGWKGGMAHA